MDNPLQDRPANNYLEDRRKSARYLIAGRICFQWQAADANWCEARGITTNIGKSGVFIESNSVPPVASLLKLSALLPTGWATATTLCLTGSGQVCHVRQAPSQTQGFGASAVFHVQAPMSPGLAMENR